MAIVLDSAVIISGERGTLDLERWLASMPEEHFLVAAITIAELWHGVERATAPHRKKRVEYLDACLTAIQVVPYVETTAREHARLWAELEMRGKMIGDYDLIVAATALELGCPVATLNRKHFSQVKGLRVIVPF